LGRNEFAIRNQNSGMVLDVTMASKANDANVQQFPWNGTTAQRWRVQGSQIINVNSGKCLDVAYKSRADGGTLTSGTATAVPAKAGKSVVSSPTLTGVIAISVQQCIPGFRGFYFSKQTRHCGAIWIYDSRIEELLFA